MTYEEFETILPSIIEEAKLLFMSVAPKRNLFLMENIKSRKVSDGYELYIDKAVYYQHYTNKPWISPRWRGRENPNLGWIDEAFELISDFIAYKLGGTLERGG